MQSAFEESESITALLDEAAVCTSLLSMLCSFVTVSPVNESMHTLLATNTISILQANCCVL